MIQNIPHKNSNPAINNNNNRLYYEQAMQNTTLRNIIEATNQIDMMLYDTVVQQYYDQQT